jgi:hypothetical protein
MAADRHQASGDLERARRILEPLAERLPPGTERAQVLRRLVEPSGIDEAERLLEQASLEATSAPRLGAEIAGDRVLVTFLRHGPAASARLARACSPLLEASGDLALIASFLAQRCLSELCADGITPGVLERALELERQVGPLPAATTPTLVEGLRLTYADRPDAARAALQRVHALGLERDDEATWTQALLFLGELECRAGRWRQADAYARELFEASEQRGLEAPRRFGAVAQGPGRRVPRPARSGSRTGDRGAGGDRRARRGPRPARLAGGRRSPAAEAVAASAGRTLPRPGAGRRGRPLGGGDRLRGGPDRAPADARAVRARAHAADPRHAAAAGEASRRRQAGHRAGGLEVEGALKRVYRKLGVRARTELSRRLSDDP